MQKFTSVIMLAAAAAASNNVVTENAAGVGEFGGSCTCPDGQVYQVGDENNSCGSLACGRGVSGKCNTERGPWTGRKVECSVKTQGPPIRGTNIGGLFVLEPWITPSLFYRFLGKTKTEGVGMDSYSLCEALGPTNGNALMRAHWDSWFTEDHAKGLADREVTMVRLPIGDWTHRPYGPYVGCMDGAADKIKEVLDIFAKYNIKVLLDVHAMKGSQNGFDNSGVSNRTTWKDENHFEHWKTAFGEWMGVWGKNSYDSFNYDNIQWGIDNVDLLVKNWGTHPAVAAIQPLNEPWWSSDKYILYDFYRRIRYNMKKSAPHLKFVFHDSFHGDASYWNELFPDNDMENVVMDTHFYQAWWGAQSIDSYCEGYTNSNTHLNDIKYDVWVGEWSLATDVCAMWLGGFNDNNTPYAYPCKWVDCPKPYLPAAQAVDVDRTAKMLGPFGSNTLSTVQNGKCPMDSSFFGDSDVQKLGQCAIKAWNKLVQGHFMWTFRNELEPKWEYVRSYDMGWIKEPTSPAASTHFQPLVCTVPVHKTVANAPNLTDSYASKCTCPDGEEFEVGANADSCWGTRESRCEGGTFSDCRSIPNAHPRSVKSVSCVKDTTPVCAEDAK